MIDISNVTYGIHANALDLVDAWLKSPSQRREFGEREIFDLREAALKINLLLTAIKEAA